MAEDRNTLRGIEPLQYRRRPRLPSHPNPGLPRRWIALTFSDPLTRLSFAMVWASLFSWIFDARIALGSLRIPTWMITDATLAAAVLLVVIPGYRTFQWYRYAVAVSARVLRMGSAYRATVEYALDDINFHGIVRLPEMRAWRVSPGDSLVVIVNANQPESPRYDPELAIDVQRG